MKKFYLFTKNGVTFKPYFGSIYESLPTHTVNYHGFVFTFKEYVDMGLCKEFETRNQAAEYKPEVEDFENPNSPHTNIKDGEMF